MKTGEIPNFIGSNKSENVKMMRLIYKTQGTTQNSRTTAFKDSHLTTRGQFNNVNTLLNVLEKILGCIGRFSNVRASTKKKKKIKMVLKHIIGIINVFGL